MASSETDSGAARRSRVRRSRAAERFSDTPGGVGVTQALNVLVLEGTTSTANATAYSVAQQLIVSAWDVVFAIVLVAWVFGWSGGRELVRQSYADAQVKERELKQKRDARRAARAGRRQIKP